MSLGCHLHQMDKWNLLSIQVTSNVDTLILQIKSQFYYFGINKL